MQSSDRAPAAVPDPPWWRPQGRATRSTLDRQAIVHAALEVLEADGLAGLSMRRLAERLGTGAATLYWHVSDRDQLLDLVLDRVLGEVPLPAPDPDRWREQLIEFGQAMRTALGRYRDLASATLGRVPIGPNMLRIADWNLSLLLAAGIPARPAAWFGDIGGLFIAAQVIEDQLDSQGDDTPSRMGAYLAVLPAELLPSLRAVGAELTGGDADDRFIFGLELLLRGLATFTEDR